MKFEETIDDTYQEFMTKMVEWVKSGSALGAKMEFDINKKKNKIRLNKRAAMNYILPEEV